jgi:hypothetical protein
MDGGLRAGCSDPTILMSEDGLHSGLQGTHIGRDRARQRHRLFTAAHVRRERYSLAYAEPRLYRLARDEVRAQGRMSGYR